jgi:hypothetical protein
MEPNLGQLLNSLTPQRITRVADFSEQTSITVRIPPPLAAISFSVRAYMETRNHLLGGDPRFVQSCLFAALYSLKTVKVKVISRLTVYRQSVCLGVKPFETHDQRLFQLNPCCSIPYVTSSLTRRWVCLLWNVLYQYRLCKAYHTHLTPQRQLSHLNGRKLNHHEVEASCIKLSSYLTENTLRLRYKVQPANAV